ncbi:MAG: Rdx family protein [Gemmatimonadetes bacterium]|nr:Rdx family protein [Gemmatimonadota bacterium]MBT8479318.1 Rdx family protein [Gemmatimonadota bacterium]
MAARLKKRYPDLVIDLIRSGGGVFEVQLDGQLIYSKKATGRHCTPEEILSLIDG